MFRSDYYDITVSWPSGTMLQTMILPYDPEEEKEKKYNVCLLKWKWEWNLTGCDIREQGDWIVVTLDPRRN